MKIIYLIEWEFCKEDGVIKKVLNQVRTWKSIGHDVKLFVLSNCKDTIKIEVESVYVYHKSFWNKLYFPSLYQDIENESPDLIYFRYSAYKPYLNKILNNYKTVMELNSNIIDEKKLQRFYSVKDFMTYYYILVTNKYLENISSGIVSVTHEIAKTISKKQKNVIVIPNSIELNVFQAKKKPHSNRDIVHLVFIGTANQEWHGIDKILTLAKKTVDTLHFHIIGINDPKDAVHNNITYHGYLKKEEYEKVIINSDIGIGTLALHRKNMDEACPLKVREYLAYGLPVIMGYEDTAFMNYSFNKILKLNNNQGNINQSIQKIIEFSKSNKDILVTQEEVEDKISSKELEKKRIKFMEII